MTLYEFFFHLSFVCLYAYLEGIQHRTKTMLPKKKKKKCCRENPKFYSGAIWLCLVGLTQLSLLDISFFFFFLFFLISYLLTMKLIRPASLFMLTGVQNNSLKLKVSVWNVLVNSFSYQGCLLIPLQFFQLWVGGIKHFSSAGICLLHSVTNLCLSLTE